MDSNTYFGAGNLVPSATHGDRVSTQGPTGSCSRRETSPSSSTNQVFFFVDDKTSSRGKRSHVMKHHIREKKKGQSRLMAGELSTQRGRHSRILPWTKRAAQRISELDSLVSSNSSSPTVSVANGHSSQSTASPLRWPCCLSPRMASSPISGDINVSRTDPFETLPIEIDDEAQKLINLWTTKLAYWSGQNLYMKTAVFKEAILHPMTLHVTILTYSARYQSHISGYRDTPISVVYASAAERKLAEYMQTAADPCDKRIIMALTALALQEDRYGSKEKARRHIEGAMQRARCHLGQSPLHETFLHYVRYTMSPEGPLQDPNDVHQLLSFLRKAETLASDTLIHHQVPLWMSAFEFGTPLHLLLSSGPHPTSVPSNDRVWVVKYGSLHDTCRVASLVYITMTMLDYSKCPEKCTRFLDAMVSKVRERGLDQSTSTESLLWLLLEEPYSDTELKNPLRAWFAGDLMVVVSKLPKELHFQYGELLLRQLMRRGPDLEFSIEKFETEIWKVVQKLPPEPAGSYPLLSPPVAMPIR
ncbi:hypothetical protein VTO42DRAFT_2051 [Malbranchea cinnamomea]